MALNYAEQSGTDHEEPQPASPYLESPERIASNAQLAQGKRLWNRAVAAEPFRLALVNEAAACLQTALQLDLHNDAARRTLAEIKLKLQRPEEAYAVLMPLLTQEPQDAPTRLLLADISFQRREVTAAEGRVRRLIAADPTYCEAHLLLARIQIQQGFAGSAFESVLRALRHDPASRNAQRHLTNLIDEYLPLPADWGTGPITLSSALSGNLRAPFLALDRRLKTQIKLALLPPAVRARIRQVRGETRLTWRDPATLGLLLTVCLSALTLMLVLKLVQFLS